MRSVSPACCAARALAEGVSVAAVPVRRCRGPPENFPPLGAVAVMLITPPCGECGGDQAPIAPGSNGACPIPLVCTQSLCTASGYEVVPNAICPSISHCDAATSAMHAAEGLSQSWQPLFQSSAVTKSDMACSVDINLYNFCTLSACWSSKCCISHWAASTRWRSVCAGLGTDERLDSNFCASAAAAGGKPKMRSVRAFSNNFTW
mmetsp:Transcript_128922/g.321574  ORF Transcript_128922/g.321574 Transcript_128922/m.321574 type:complete len:205 (-) Transcript_128922:596-1210(-)